MSKRELLPCPFCGGPAEYVTGEREAACADSADPYTGAGCANTVIMSVSDWNRRASREVAVPDDMVICPNCAHQFRAIPRKGLA